MAFMGMGNKMTPQDLESIKTRLEKATAGEWKVNFKEDVIQVGPVGAEDLAWITNQNDADFIAHSKQDIESLLREVEKEKVAYGFALREIDRLMKESQRYRTALELIDGCFPVIEAWAVMSPAQAEWKKNWLAKAKTLLPREGSR
jgi:hypothetical protein